MCDLSSVALVVHQEELEFPDVGDKELLEPVGKAMAGLLVATITNLTYIVRCIKLCVLLKPLYNAP